MKDFFIECLKDLKDLTGINQLHWIMQECKDQQEFDKKKDNIIKSMVLVSEQFNYIPEEDQKRIIRDQMIKDQDYDSLNSRVVWKWLNLYKEHFASINNAPEEIPRVILTEEQNKKIDELLNQYKEQLKGDFRPDYSKVDSEIEKIQKEDKARNEKPVSLTIGYKPQMSEDQFNRKMKAISDRGLNKVDFNDLLSYEIEGKTILARNESEAQEMYLEIYL